MECFPDTFNVFKFILQKSVWWVCVGPGAETLLACFIFPCFKACRLVFLRITDKGWQLEFTSPAPRRVVSVWQ